MYVCRFRHEVGLYICSGYLYLVGVPEYLLNFRSSRPCTLALQSGHCLERRMIHGAFTPPSSCPKTMLSQHWTATLVRDTSPTFWYIRQSSTVFKVCCPWVVREAYLYTPLSWRTICRRGRRSGCIRTWRSPFAFKYKFSHPSLKNHHPFPRAVLSFNDVHCHHLHSTEYKCYLILNLLTGERVQEDNIVRLFSTTTGKLTQKIPHPRAVINLTWRHSEAASRFVPSYLTPYIRH